jgi:flagellar assembly factor FliW
MNRMLIESTRFGTVEIRDDAVITFPDGLIGLPGTRYALIAQSENTAFYWLHSVEDPSIALPVTNPWLFFGDYEVRVPDEDAEKLSIEHPEQADIFCVVRAAEQLEDFTVNLRGPLVVHAALRVGRQIINDAADFGVRQPLFSEVALAQVRPAAPVAPVAATGI